MKFTDRVREALIKAIRDFFTWDDIFNDAELNELATQYVYEHDQEIRDHIAETTDISDWFDNAVIDIDSSDIF